MNKERKNSRIDFVVDRVEKKTITTRLDRLRIIGSPADAIDAVRKHFAGLDVERFRVLCLDARHRVRANRLVSSGTANASLVHPRDVFRAAIKANAVSFVILHNHPSGDPTPSEDDLLLARRLSTAGELMGIEMIDFIVAGFGAFFSYCDDRTIETFRTRMERSSNG